MSSPYLSPSFWNNSSYIKTSSLPSGSAYALHPFSSMPHTFPLLSTNLPELLPPLKTLLLKHNTICHIQHTAPAAPVAFSTTVLHPSIPHPSPDSQTAPGSSRGIWCDILGRAAAVPAALCCQRRLACSSTPAASKPMHPTRARCFGKLEKPEARKRDIFQDHEVSSPHPTTPFTREGGLDTSMGFATTSASHEAGPEKLQASQRNHTWAFLTKITRQLLLQNFSFGTANM